MERPVLEANGISKSYGGRRALTDLTFSLGEGRILGFLGPNGAGKTTAIRILTTILPPSAGSFQVAGIGSEDGESIRRSIGVLPESLGFPARNTAIEYLSYFGRAYGRTKADSLDRARALLDEAGLAGRENSLIGSYSRGMRQRLGIARTLIGDPRVVFLDEPTLGLDPRGQQQLLGLIKRIASERRAGVVLCSHLLAEVESVCDDVVILAKGETVANGPVGAVVASADRARSGMVRLEVDPGMTGEAVRVIQSGELALVVEVAHGRGEILVDMGSDRERFPVVRQELLRRLVESQIDVLGFRTDGSRLQDVFLQLTEVSA